MLFSVQFGRKGTTFFAYMQIITQKSAEFAKNLLFHLHFPSFLLSPFAFRHSPLTLRPFNPFAYNLSPFRL